MKLIELFTDEVVTDEIKEFRQWVEQQREDMHKFRESFLESKMKYWEEEDQRHREMFDGENYPEDEWAIDFNDTQYVDDWYTPTNIRELKKKGVNSHSEDNIKDFLNDESNWEGSKTLSYLLGAYNRACAGCGDDDDDVRNEFCILADYPNEEEFDEEYEDFSRAEYNKGADI